MGSTRLNSKTLSPVAGVILLKRVYECVLSLNLSDDVIVATSSLAEDDDIESFCDSVLNCECIRGSSKDV